MSNAGPPESRDAQPHRNPALYQQMVSDGIADADHSADRVLEDTTANAAIHADAAGAAAREAHTTAEPPDLDPPGSGWPEPEWPDPGWPGYPPGRRPPSYSFTIAASPWYKERYPDKAVNLWDALRAGRTPQPAPEPDRLADREAGE